MKEKKYLYSNWFYYVILYCGDLVLMCSLTIDQVLTSRIGTICLVESSILRIISSGVSTHVEALSICSVDKM